MNNICCDNCLPDESQSTFVPWSYRKEQQSIKRNQSSLTTTPSSYTRISSNRNYFQKQKQKSRIHTSPLSATTHIPIVRNRTTSLILPVDQSILQQKIKQIKNLQKQNSQYLSIINNQLIPLKRDYQILKIEYKRKLQLVDMMDEKLQELQQMYYLPVKSVLNSTMTRI